MEDISLIVAISLSTLTVAVLAMIFALLYFLFRESRRITRLERTFAGFQDRVGLALEQQPPPVSDNPGVDVAARRQELLHKMRADQINRIEAIELSQILEKERAAAQKRGDIAALAAIILGLALLAAILNR